MVAMGNPDTARHTAVLVPGTGTQLDKFTGQISRIDKLQDAAGRRTPGAGADVSVISWMDYDAPEPDLSVATRGRAEAGAQDLRDFTQGLRSAHQGDPTHLTVIGHSYGSTMAGAADAGGAGLGADDVLVVGSPGLTVERADQLHVAPSHLWVGAAKDDLVSNDFSGLTLGEDPKEPGFGAQRMYVDTAGHSGYWDEGSQSLNNQGRIIAGKTPEGPRS
ncbi:alpha/beta hydrolase [Streptomyces sp. NPDC098789]|uniref:alpha/beta hydrolase n=1 Tax=Streptomyces sp. NPDC098789 TaxID=3366098 RepID=UPI00382B8CC9